MELQLFYLNIAEEASVKFPPLQGAAALKIIFVTWKNKTTEIFNIMFH